MKRVVLLTPNLEQANSILAQLRSNNIADKDIFIVSNGKVSSDEVNISAEQIKTTSETSTAGAILGGMVGLFAGLTALPFPGSSAFIWSGATLGASALGAGIGAWLASMLDKVGDDKIKAYQQAVEAGNILLLLHLPDESYSKILKSIKAKYASTKIESADAEMLEAEYL